MKRRLIIKLSVFLLFGAVVNVAVAWGCSRVWSPPVFMDATCWCGSFSIKDDDTSQSYTGWPTRIVLIHWPVDDAWQGQRSLFMVTGWTVVPNYMTYPCTTEPIWPGFAINTLFYAAILWLLFAAPGRVRRWRRVRRGLCAKCAYPVGTSEVCTECGAGVKVARLSEP